MDKESLNNLLKRELEILIFMMNQEFNRGNPYEELDKALKIVKSRNYNQYFSLENKMRDFTMSIYNNRMDNYDSINYHLSRIDGLIDKIVSCT